MPAPEQQEIPIWSYLKDISLSVNSNTVPLTLWTTHDSQQFKSSVPQSSNYNIVSAIDKSHIPFWALDGGHWKVSSDSSEAVSLFSLVFSQSADKDSSLKALIIEESTKPIRDERSDDTNELINPSRMAIYSNIENDQMVIYATNINVKAQFLNNIKLATQNKQSLPNVMHDRYFDISSGSGLDRVKSVFLGSSASRKPSNFPPAFDQTQSNSNPFAIQQSQEPSNPFLVAKHQTSKETPFLGLSNNRKASKTFSETDNNPAGASPSIYTPLSVPGSRSGSVSSVQQQTVTSTADATRQKQALQHLVLAALRLRGVTRDTLGSDEYKELYHQTFRAAQFAMAQRSKVLNPKNGNGKPGLIDLQDVVDKLLNMFLPEA